MASSNETKAQVARESERRSKLSAPTLASGLLYLLSGIIIAATVGGAPSVGLLEGCRRRCMAWPDPPKAPAPRW